MEMHPSPSFWEHLEKLIASSPLKIDHPKGTCHPRYPEMVYPIDYGYLEGTVAANSSGIDVWLGCSGNHVLSGVIVTVDLHKRDTEIKLLLGCAEDEVQTMLDFHNTKTMQAMLVSRPPQKNCSSEQFPIL
jgi:inorganic pyrophosphatase